MPTLICSDVNHPELLALLSQEGVAGMVNTASACQPRLLATYDRFPTVPLYLDSGAFQDNRDLRGNRQVIERFGWVANPDVTSDAGKSDANYRALTHALRPHLADKILWVYQGGPLTDLADIARERKLVGHAAIEEALCM
jgi:hypothetical protein